MMPVYCISGLGADERIFSKLRLKNCEIRYIKWVKPNSNNEPIESYALRLSTQIQHKNPILVGVSFGGIIAVEIAKIICCKKIFLISTIKSKSELPLWVRLIGLCRVNKIVPFTRRGSILVLLENYFLGPETVEEKRLISEFRKATDKFFLYWAVSSIVNWRNTIIPDNFVHLLGDRDKFFSVKKSNPNYIIHGGTHLMIYNRSQEISNIIQSQL
ncbi:MAG TPA: hypothetical protein VFN30_15580 [Chitinophagaceae bacterium]|nr:hypothetical protein [Chitinophagaceae bacterium]